jgi:DNA-binding winged helix-turn-helix (wHTH) protein/tetratricopeptide (TPR) repeat protein
MAGYTYYFDNCIVDPAARELRRGGQAISLPPMAFDCIAYLIEHRDRAVGRDELIAAVWGKADVDDAQLAHVVRKARRAIGDSGTEQSAIHTLPRFGFRWVREVEVRSEAVAVDPAPAPLPAPRDDIVPPPVAGKNRLAPIRGGRIAIFTGLALGAALLAAAWIGGWTETANQEGHQASVAPASQAAIAVLPVDTGAINESEWAWLRLGLMDLIGTRLRDAGLTVVTSSNVVALMRDQPSITSAIDQIRSATGTRYLVAPSITRVGDEWLVHLSWGENGELTHNVEGRSGDALSAAMNATDRLLGQIGTDTGAEAGLTSPLPVAELVQQAEAAALVGDFDDARTLLTQAPAELRDSPDLQLSLARVELSAGNFETARQHFAKLEANTSAKTAPQLRARALIGLGNARFRLRDFEGIETLMTEALSLLTGGAAPADTGEAFLRRGSLHMHRSRLNEAGADFSQARVAFELAGDSLASARVDFNIGILQHALGRSVSALPLFEGAATQFERFGAMPDLVLARSNQINLYLALLQPAEALQVASLVGTRFDELDAPQYLHIFQWQRARALQANGRLDEARTLLEELAGSVNPKEEAVTAPRVHTARAQMAFDAGAYRDAADLAIQVTRSPPSSADETTRSLSWLIATRALRRLGHDSKASDETRRFQMWAVGEQTHTRISQLAQAEQARAENRYIDAAHIYEDVLTWSTHHAPPVTVAEVTISYVNFLLEQGNLDRASAVAGQVGPWVESDFRCALLMARLYRALGQADAWRSALAHARVLAGERRIPPAISAPL